MANELTEKERLFLNVLDSNTIYRAITGSTSYGTSIKSSDQDEKSIVILPKKSYFTLLQEWETSAFHEPDWEFHSLRKFMLLANKQNPTILELLFTEERFVTVNSKYGKALREVRNLFLTKNCFYAFGGYAREQLMRIKAGLEKLTEEDERNHLLQLIERLLRQFEETYSEMTPSGIVLNSLERDKEGKFDIYLGVNLDNISLTQLFGMLSEINNISKTYNKTNHRNRKADGKLFKHAMHLIRLLKMGIEVLTTGTIQVYRYADRDFLLDVRNEVYTWDEIFEMVHDLELELKQAYLKSDLPEKTDFEKINEVYNDLMLDWFVA